MYFYCEKCKKKHPINTKAYHCECGGLFRLFKNNKDDTAHDISIGETKTTLMKINVKHMDFLLKMENLQPTGSFKDRGAYTLINELYKLGIDKIVEDSSGNAGASIAAYAAAAGMDCTIYLPADISPGKIDQIKGYGAKVVAVKGSRGNTTKVAQKKLGDAYYASHVYNPLFFEGMKSMAYEIYHQLNDKVPDYIFMPVGNGTMLLGLYYGFEEIGRLPRFVPVQSKNCAPLYESFHKLEPIRKTKTVAEAMRVENPIRMEEMIMAVNNSLGDVIAVEDEEILKAKEYLGHHGIYIETTAAAALAGALKVFKYGKPDNYNVVIPLTGSGLKA
ncbi:MAG: pyridoxal-phosphate dependent enzyme [Selenomonadaceae bacterium]